jgi:hypothetical protein
MAITRAAETLAEELAERWTSFFAPKDWPERLNLLQQVHEQLQEDLDDMELYCSVSSVFIRKLIERLGAGNIESPAQAHIYANSDSEEHRHLAGEWLAQRNADSAMAKFARS